MGSSDRVFRGLACSLKTFVKGLFGVVSVYSGHSSMHLWYLGFVLNLNII